MRSNESKLFFNVDRLAVILYAILVVMGWLNIYAAVYNEEHQNIFDVSQKYGKQMIWIITAAVLALVILIVDAEFYIVFAYPIFALSIVVLILVLFFGTEIAGSKSWFRFGDIGIQPAEFAKFCTNLALAKYLSKMDIKMTDLSTKLYCALIIALPIGLILLENETGCALVFTSYIFLLYREGLSGNFLLIGLLGAVLFILSLLIENKMILVIIFGVIAAVAFVFSRKKAKNIFLILSIFSLATGIIYATDYAFEKLEPHQKKRISVFLGKEQDKNKAGYNVNQAKIAIGSGGFLGKGFLQGTQTKYDFVPEQDTDFIFCTVGEEWGLLGTTTVILLFAVLIIRIIIMAERQRSPFGRIYGYGVASVLLFHLVINVGMTIGLAPVIGIPLPFFSYGGSSLWSFTILLFIFIKMDAHRLQILR